MEHHSGLINGGLRNTNRCEIVRNIYPCSRGHPVHPLPQPVHLSRRIVCTLHVTPRHSYTFGRDLCMSYSINNHMPYVLYLSAASETMGPRQTQNSHLRFLGLGCAMVTEDHSVYSLDSISPFTQSNQGVACSLE